MSHDDYETEATESVADSALLESPSEAEQGVEGLRLLVVGKLAGMSRRDAYTAIRARGGTLVERIDDAVDLIVVGEHKGLPLDERGQLTELFDAETREAMDRGTVKVISESLLWQRLGLIENQANVHRLYTPAMLAQMLHVPVAIVRRWHRRGLIRPTREVQRLPYFDFQEVASARALAQLLAAGVSPDAVERKLIALGRYLPGVERPLAQLSVIVEGKQLLLRQGAGLLEPGGQLRFDFDAPPEEAQASDEIAPAAPPTLLRPMSPWELASQAAELDDQGDLAGAEEAYRAALTAGGADADLCFRLAELLYRLGDLSAARERYYMAIELDENFAEARSNLGCVLEELGHLELAAAAFEGALVCLPDFPDVHYHLARVLEELDRRDEAADHWQAFLVLSPDSPWAEEARQRLESS
jgi:tetratricopeptide (TPR) repeat protein